MRIPKVKVKRKVSRSPYARALDQATRRYEKACLDYQRILHQKMALEEEIPRLEQVKLVLEDYLQKGHSGPRPDLLAADKMPPIESEAMEARNVLRQPLPPRVATGSLVGGVQVPAHLAHMIKPHPLVEKGAKVQGGAMHVQLSSNDPDDMLPDLGSGQDLIPDHPVIIPGE